MCRGGIVRVISLLPWRHFIAPRCRLIFTIATVALSSRADDGSYPSSYSPSLYASTAQGQMPALEPAEGMSPNDSLQSYVAPANPQSTASVSEFRPRQLILPLTLVGIGAFGVCNGAFQHLNRAIRDDMNRLRGDNFCRIDNYAQYAPIVSYIGLGSLGIKAKHSLKERFATGATAYLSLSILTTGLKYTVREKRPDSNTRNSFPSGHTATAFMGAELLREEYGLGIGIAGYCVASSIAFLRLYNNRHWLNDVISGAGIGILSARIGYWMLPLYHRWFHWDRQLHTVMMAPFYNPADRAIGVGFMARL